MSRLRDFLDPTITWGRNERPEEKYIYLDIEDDDELIDAFVESCRPGFTLDWWRYASEYE